MCHLLLIFQHAWRKRISSQTVANHKNVRYMCNSFLSWKKKTCGLKKTDCFFFAALHREIDIKIRNVDSQFIHWAALFSFSQIIMFSNATVISMNTKSIATERSSKMVISSIFFHVYLNNYITQIKFYSHIMEDEAGRY